MKTAVNTVLSVPAPLHDVAVSAQSARKRFGLSGLVIACLAATWLIWGSTYLAIKWALVSFPPYFQMGSRFVVAALLLGAWCAWRGERWPNRRQWFNAAVIGGLMLGGGMGGVAVAEQSVGSGLVVAFIAVMPLMIAALNALWGDLPKPLEALGIALGLVGVLWLVQGQGFAASPKGLVVMAVSCAAWALGSVLSQRSLPLAPGPAGFASEMLCGGVLLLVMSALSGETLHTPIQPQALAAWVYLVVAGSLMGFTAYMVLLARTSAALASSYSFVNPLIAMALGVTLAGEHISSAEWAAAGVVLAGVVLLLWARRTR